MIVWLMLTAGQWPFRRVNVMCDDLNSLTLIFHFFKQFSMICKERNWNAFSFQGKLYFTEISRFVSSA